MAIKTPGGALGQSALALGISPGVVQNLFNANSLEVFVQGKIAERNIMQAQERLESSFQQQRKAFVEFQQSFTQMVPMAAQPKTPMKSGSLLSACPIFGNNSNEGI